jgi:outer membrane protein TolC
MATNAMESVERDRGPCPGKGGRAKHLWVLLAAILFAVAPKARAETSAASAKEIARAGELTETVSAEAVDGDTLMTLPRVLALAERHSLAARIAPYDSLQAQAEIQVASASWWPRIDADASYTVRDNPVEAVFGSERFPFAQKNSAAYGIHLKETLFNGGRRKLSVQAAKQSARATEAKSWVSIREAQLDALGAYLQVLRLKDQAKVLKQRHAAVSAHSKIAQDLYDQGLVARNDLLETKVRERELADAEQELADSRASATQDLNRILGRDLSATVSLPDSLGPAPMLEDSPEGMIRNADEQNPHLKALRARLQAARTSERLTHREYWPELYLSLGHSYEENRYMAYPHVNAVVAGMSWNLFEGGARKAKIRKAQAEIARATQNLKDVQRGVSVALDSAWRQWKQSLREELTAQHNVHAAQANLQIVEDQYRSGLARSSDVLDAEVLLADSRYKVITRHYESYWNQARLLATAGEDPAEFYANVARRGAH